VRESDIFRSALEALSGQLVLRAPCLDALPEANRPLSSQLAKARRLRPQKSLPFVGLFVLLNSGIVWAVMADERTNFSAELLWFSLSPTRATPRQLAR